MIEFKDVSFKYPTSERPVLANLGLTINRGERVVVMGANGSGKTTLAFLAAGLLSPTSGVVEIDAGSQPGIVLQNPDNQIVTISVEREIAFPLECRQFEPESTREIVIQTAEAMGFSDKLKLSPYRLSGGEKQKLALATACVAGADLLILDEPFSYLDAVGRELFIQSIQSFVADSEVTVVEISQDSSIALQADRVILMKDGKIIADGTPRELLTSPDLLEECGVEAPDALMMERILECTPVEIEEPSIDESCEDAVSALQVRDLSFEWSEKAPLFSNLNVAFKEGKCTALAGASGVGKSTLAQMLSGLRSWNRGRIFLGESEAEEHDLQTSVSYLFQFPERQIFESTVRREIEFGLKQLGLNSSERGTRVREALESAGLDFGVFAERMPTLLSGGEMRKVATASVIALQRPILILDEPTAELDRNSVHSLKRLIEKNSEAGLTQIVISHDTDFLYDVCDDFIMLATGFVRYSGPKSGLLDEPGVFSDCGLSVPGIVRLCEDADWRSIIRTYRISSVAEVFRACDLSS